MVRVRSIESASGFRLPPTAAGRLSIAAVGAPSPFALAALSGAVCATTFPPLSFAPLAWVALAPLLVACAALTPRRAAMAGALWAAVMCVGVGWFLPGMLSGYFGLPLGAAWGASIAIGALHALCIGSYTAWVAWLVERRAANPLLLAGGWLVCEYARAHGELTGPWALSAYSQVEWPAMIQSADLAGAYGIGMLIAAVNAGIAAAFVPALRGRRPGLSTIAIGAAVLSAYAYGQWRLGQTLADGPAVEVAIVQGGAQEPERAARLDRYVSLTKDDAADAARLIVWPEHAVDAYLDEASPTRDAVLRTARDAHADLVVGGPHFASSRSGTRYHNSAYLVRDGHLAQRYDKHRLVPFAEEDRLGWFAGTDSTYYSAGTGSSVLSGSTLRLGALLCVEAMLPELALQAARDGAEVLLNLSNDTWLGRAEPALHQLAIATLRAVENRRYLLRAAATGYSAVVDPHGRVLAQSEFDTHQVLNATVRASHVQTFYQLWGDAFAGAVIAAVAAASLRTLLHRAIDQRRSR